MKKVILGIILLILIIVAFGLHYYKNSADRQPDLSSFQSSDGFKISFYSKGLNSPSIMAFDSLGHMAVSSAKQGTISLLTDNNHDGYAETIKTIISGLKKPYGLAFYKDATDKKEYLYVAQTDSVDRFPYDAARLLVGKPENIATLVGGGLNDLRSLMIGPKLRFQDLVTNSDTGQDSAAYVYVGAGSSCQTCEETSFKRASILESDLTGRYLAQFAHGLRDPIAMALNPLDNKMWALDIQRTDRGNSVTDEINIIDFTKDYGWPACYGNKVQDTVYHPTPTPSDQLYRKIDYCSNTVAPSVVLPPHSLASSLAFIPLQTTNWPKDWQGNMIVAYATNDKNAKRLERFVLGAKDQVLKQSDMISDFLNGNGSSIKIGDLRFSADGALFMIDIYSGNIYRLTPITKQP